MDQPLTFKITSSTSQPTTNTPSLKDDKISKNILDAPKSSINNDEQFATNIPNENDKKNASNTGISIFIIIIFILSIGVLTLGILNILGIFKKSTDNVESTKDSTTIFLSNLIVVNEGEKSKITAPVLNLRSVAGSNKSYTSSINDLTLNTAYDSAGNPTNKTMAYNGDNLTLNSNINLNKNFLINNTINGRKSTLNYENNVLNTTDVKNNNLYSKNIFVKVNNDRFSKTYVAYIDSVSGSRTLTFDLKFNKTTKSISYNYKNTNANGQTTLIEYENELPSNVFIFNNNGSSNTQIITVVLNITNSFIPYKENPDDVEFVYPIQYLNGFVSKFDFFTISNENEKSFKIVVNSDIEYVENQTNNYPEIYIRFINNYNNSKSFVKTLSRLNNNANIVLLSNDNGCIECTNWCRYRNAFFTFFCDKKFCNIMYENLIDNPYTCL